MGISRISPVSAEKMAASAARRSAAGSSRASARDRADFSEQAQAASASASSAEKKASEEKKSYAELIKEQTDKIDKLFSKDDQSSSNNNQLTSIKQKIRSGLTLSISEEQYLSKHDPDSYSNYRTVLDSRRMFRAQLSCCRTKDEVNGMRLSNALAALSSYKKAMKNGGDGSEIAGLNMALEREISSFSQSARYRSLPTAAERDKYYMELAKARKFEREKREAQRLNSRSKKKKQVKQPGDGKRTVAQVENSALGRKVRNAGKGGSCGFGYSSFAGCSYKKMDQKG